MNQINHLLTELPTESSVVITSADTMLRELFSHRGSGTFFRCTEAVHLYTSFAGIDLDRLRALLHRYSGVAIILKGQKTDVNYLCKFAVTDKAQGQGIGELLWDTVRQAEPSLFWRSKNSNPINTWYFKKCEGSWNNPTWNIFWYGVQDPTLSSVIISEALSRPDTFEVDGGEKPQRELMGTGGGK
ncbi:N-acetylglutamate synthase, mitochondrial-like [Plakobranchus ocellatus]|uniref:N-acetylglutamate synthase, mitochondrial-like n=1 Tax=Plakobranchus ocellatus TaxID=259542 RepID=A0AAV4DT74_9GAST|nr:N-acetylglutamate synthase, mitochondrial-like [Plakobranchus ocellatus]